MKRTLLVLSVTFFTGLMNAQPLPSDVTEPGAKGLLPKAQDVAPARERELPILYLSDVGFDPFIVNGITHNQANLSFPMVSETGCEYYTVHYKAPADTKWSTIMSGDSPQHLSGYSVGISPSLNGMMQFRLTLHGGEHDGFVSNTVTAKPLSMFSRYTGWSESPTVEYCMVGIPIGNEFTVNAETYKSGTITGYYSEENPECFTYQWYRCNPYNADMEPIRGATDRIYTPTADDLGYNLVIEVGGDKEHLDFLLYHTIGSVVSVPVQASVAYVGKDGFILNTDYVIPEPQKMFIRGEYWIEDVPELDGSCISEVAPGQYAFRLPEEEYNYCIYALNNPSYFLTFIYKGHGMDGGDWYREAQIMTDRYKGQLNVKPLKDGNAVATTIDVIGKDIDGKWGVVASQEVNSETGEAVFEQNWETDTDNRIFFGEYYVKARSTDSTLETFYPSTPIWTSASLVDIEHENMWDPKQVEIALQQLPAPLTGTGLIEGNVNTELPKESRRKAMAREGITVYLLDAANNIVGQCTTDADGSFYFEHLPFGSYTVLPNIAGYTVVAPTEVTLSAERPIVSDVYYSMSDDQVIPTGIGSTTISNATVQGIWSLSGIQKPTRGLNIVRMSDGTMKKIIRK